MTLVLNSYHESAQNYPYPQYSENPNQIFENVNDLLKFLEDNHLTEYSIYWGSEDPKSSDSVFILFNGDGTAIFGAALPSGKIMDNFQTVISFSKAKFGYVDFDSPPPYSIGEFFEVLRQTNQPKCNDGKYLNLSNFQS